MCFCKHVWHMSCFCWYVRQVREILRDLLLLQRRQRMRDLRAYFGLDNYSNVPEVISDK